MRYHAGHSETTRKRIVEHAARRFRASGLTPGIGRLMQELGLTHGGFYAHFSSKNHLIRAALVQAVEEMMERLFRAALRDPDRAFEGLVLAYLHQSHCEEPEKGCTLPALAAEISRQDGEIRDEFTVLLKGMIAAIEGISLHVPEKERREHTLMVLSTLSGSVMLARAVSDRSLQQAFLDSARNTLLRPFRIQE